MQTAKHCQNPTMPVFSFTAPIISPEEERREVESLSELVKQDYHNQLYGTEPEIEETDELLNDSLEKFYQCLDQRSDEEKREYLMAREDGRPPGLLLEEANPVKFLRCEKYNATVRAVAAAHNATEPLSGEWKASLSFGI